MAAALPASIKAILFDLDGTLVDTAVKIADALNVMRSRRGLGGVDLDLVRRSVSLGAEGLMLACLGDALQDLRADLAVFRTLLAETISNAEDLYEGAAPMIEALAASYRLAIVTNKPRALALKLLSDLGLGHCFAVVVGGDTADHPKPSAAPIAYALQVLGVEGSDALMVGDSDLDARAAEAAGCSFALFTGGYGPKIAAQAIAALRFERCEDLVRVLRERTRSAVLGVDGR